MRIKDIAAFLNKSYSYVYGICKELKQPKKVVKSETKEVVLTLNHYLETQEVTKH